MSRQTKVSLCTQHSYCNAIMVAVWGKLQEPSFLIARGTKMGGRQVEESQYRYFSWLWIFLTVIILTAIRALNEVNHFRYYKLPPVRAFDKIFLNIILVYFMFMMKITLDITLLKLVWKTKIALNITNFMVLTKVRNELKRPKTI